MVSMEVVVGTYEEVLVGLSLTKDGDVYSLTETFTDKSNIGSIKCVAVSQQGLLASGGTDEIIHIFNLKNHRLVGTLTHHSGTVTNLEFFKRTDLFSASEDGTFCAWRVGNWEPRTFKGHKGTVNSVAVHPSGKLALTVGQDKSLRTWNLVDGRPAFVSNIKEVAEMVLWSPDGKHYLTYSKEISVYSVEDGQIKRRIATKHRVNSIVFVTDNLIAYGGEGATLRGSGEREKASLFFVDIIEGTELHQIQTESCRIRGLAICLSHEDPGSGEKWLTSVASDGTINVHRVNATQTSVKTELIMSRNITLRLTCVAVSSPKYPISEGAEKKLKKQKRKWEEAETECEKVKTEQKEVETEQKEAETEQKEVETDCEKVKTEQKEAETEKKKGKTEAEKLKVESESDAEPSEKCRRPLPNVKKQKKLKLKKRKCPTPREPVSLDCKKKNGSERKK